MHEQRVELIERDALARARAERVPVVVGIQEPVAGIPEQRQHGQIDFPMTAIGGRIDETRAAARVSMQVAAPEVAMEPRGRFGGADQIRHLR